MATPGRKRKDGTQPWRAHWRLDNGQQRTKTLATKEAALKWEEKMRRERDELILDTRSMARETTVAAWIEEWWRLNMGNSTLATRQNYARVINKYLAPELGQLPMSQLRPHRIADMRDELLERGERPSSVAYALTVLSSCLAKAVERGFFDANPCRNVSKPGRRAVRKEKWPPAPLEIELLRREFLTYRAPNSGAWEALRGATIISVMAYAGLRPEEVMGLKLRAFDPEAKILRVEDVFAAEHRPDDTKTHYQRTVELLDVVAEDLKLWINAVGLEDPGGWLFPPQLGADVSASTHRNWAARPWRRARAAVIKERPEFERTLGQATPRDLRAACVSLFARAGHSDADIAEMTGHSIEVLRRHYLGAIKTLRRLPRRSEGQQIQLAREESAVELGAEDAINQLREAAPACRVEAVRAA